MLDQVPRKLFEGEIKPIAGDAGTGGSPLLSLPLDSLHCIASFLTPIEWSNLGQTGRSASNASREIFRRIRMHGFRCATEIVTAWVSEVLLQNPQVLAGVAATTKDLPRLFVGLQPQINASWGGCFLL